MSSSDKNNMRKSSSPSSSDENGPKSPPTNFYKKRLRASTQNQSQKKESHSSQSSVLTDNSVLDKPYIASGETASSDSFEFNRKKKNVYRSPVKGNKPISLEFSNDPPSKKRKLTYADVLKSGSSDEGGRSPIRTRSRSSALSTETELSSPFSKEKSKGRKKILRKKRNIKSKDRQTPGRKNLTSSDENVKASTPIAQKPSGKG